MSRALSGIGLGVQLALRRFGWENALALALPVLACAAYFIVLPELRAREHNATLDLENARRSLQRAQAAPVVVPTTNEQRLQEFYDLLGDSRYAEQQVKTLFSIAAKNNLTLSQGEYKLSYDKNGAFHTYTIMLPVHGQYGAIRTFCQQVLLAVPFASLDQVDFKRDNINNANLEAKLRFTLYLEGTDSAGVHAGAQE